MKLSKILELYKVYFTCTSVHESVINNYEVLDNTNSKHFVSSVLIINLLCSLDETDKKQ